MSLAPVFLVLAALSLPARSTRESLPTYNIIYNSKCRYISISLS
jgi:hypothetical protein